MFEAICCKPSRAPFHLRMLYPYRYLQVLTSTLSHLCCCVYASQQLFKEEPPQSDGMPSQEVLSELHEVVQAAGIEGEEGCLWGAFNTNKGPTVSTYMHIYTHTHC
jgi:hypothetical protein